MSSDQKHQISCLVWDPEPDCADHIGPNSFKSHRFVVCDELFKMFSLLKLEIEAGGGWMTATRTDQAVFLTSDTWISARAPGPGVELWLIRLAWRVLLAADVTDRNLNL